MEPNVYWKLYSVADSLWGMFIIYMLSQTVLYTFSFLNLLRCWLMDELTVIEMQGKKAQDHSVLRCWSQVSWDILTPSFLVCFFALNSCLAFQIKWLMRSRKRPRFYKMYFHFLWPLTEDRRLLISREWKLEDVVSTIFNSLGYMAKSISLAVTSWVTWNVIAFCRGLSQSEGKESHVTVIWLNFSTSGNMILLF